MGEAIVLIGLAAAVAQLVNYGGKVVKRLNEFDSTVKGLPESFSKVHVQLPLLLNVIDHLHAQAGTREFAPETESLLLPLLEGLRKEIKDFDDALLKVLPSTQASNREKITKAIKSVGIEKKFDQFRSSIQDYMNILGPFQQTHHSDVLRELIASVDTRNAGLTKSQALQSRKPVWMVKYDWEEDFVGRSDIMNTADSQIREKNHRVALAGIGGVGKSRIAIQYCYRYLQEHESDHVFWIHGGSKSRFETDYRRLARLLDLPDREDRDVDILRVVSEWLSQEANGSWLMVLDNADDRNLWLGPGLRTTKANISSAPLIDYLPQCVAGHLLITTRDRQLGYKLLESKWQPLDITRLEPEEARLLLSAKLPGNEELDQKDADELARELEYLPLTITQAAAYLEQTEITASEYLEIFRAGLSDIPKILEESIDDPSRDRESSNSVFQTWRISFEQIAKQSPIAADMLSLMAVLDRQAISRELIQGSGHNIMDHKAAIAKLKAFSLVQEEKSSAKYTIHRLVQLSTQGWLADHARLSLWQRAAVCAVAREYPENVTFEKWPLIQDMSSHVQTVLAYETAERNALVDRARILRCLGHYTMEQGQVLTLIEEVLGPTSEDAIRVLIHLAYTYNKLRQWREAEDVGLRALSSRVEHQGHGHPDTLTIMGTLAWTYRAQSRFQEAEELESKVLERRLEVLRVDHPKTQVAMANMAELHGLLGRWEKAEKLQQEVVEEKKWTVGPQHWSTRRAEQYLAMLHQVLTNPQNDEAVKRYLTKGNGDRPRARNPRSSQGPPPKTKYNRTNRHDRTCSRVESMKQKPDLQKDAYTNLQTKREALQRWELQMAGLNQDLEQYDKNASRSESGITCSEFLFLKDKFMSQTAWALANAQAEYGSAQERARVLSKAKHEYTSTQISHELIDRTLPDSVAKLNLTSTLSVSNARENHPSSVLDASATLPLMMRSSTTDSMDTLVELEPENAYDASHETMELEKSFFAPKIRPPRTTLEAFDTKGHNAAAFIANAIPVTTTSQPRTPNPSGGRL